MYTNSYLCSKIRYLYPDIGECGIDVKVDFDKQNDAYVVDLKKDHHELKTYLDIEDAKNCMEGKQCIGLSFEIAQLKANIETV